MHELNETRAYPPYKLGVDSESESNFGFLEQSTMICVVCQTKYEQERDTMGQYEGHPLPGGGADGYTEISLRLPLKPSKPGADDERIQR